MSLTVTGSVCDQVTGAVTGVPVFKWKSSRETVCLTVVTSAVLEGRFTGLVMCLLFVC